MVQVAFCFKFVYLLQKKKIRIPYKHYRMKKGEKEEILIKIGERIEQRRVELGLSKPKFAQLIGTSRPQLNRIINGEVNSSIVRLKEICELTKLNLSELVSL